MDTTAFGASWDLPPTATAAVLRAQAATSLRMLPATPLNAAAATVAAHVWATVTGETSLRGAHRHSASEVAVAAAILARAAGYRVGPSCGVAAPEVLAPDAAGHHGTQPYPAVAPIGVSGALSEPPLCVSAATNDLSAVEVPSVVTPDVIDGLLGDWDLDLEPSHLSRRVMAAMADGLTWVRAQDFTEGCPEDVFAAAAADLSRAHTHQGGEELLVAAQLLAAESLLEW